MKKILMMMLVVVLFVGSTFESYSDSVRTLPNGRKEITFNGTEEQSQDGKTSHCVGQNGVCRVVTTDKLTVIPQGDVVDVWRPAVGIGKLRVTLLRPLDYQNGLTVLEYLDNPAYPMVYTNYNDWRIAMEALQP